MCLYIVYIYTSISVYKLKKFTYQTVVSYNNAIDWWREQSTTYLIGKDAFLWVSVCSCYRKSGLLSVLEWAHFLPFCISPESHHSDEIVTCVCSELGPEVPFLTTLTRLHQIWLRHTFAVSHYFRRFLRVYVIVVFLLWKVLYALTDIVLFQYFLQTSYQLNPAASSI